MRSPFHAPVVALIACVILCVPVTVGCSGGEATEQDSGDAPSRADGASDATATVEVSLYFVSGEAIVPVGREVAAGDLDALVAALLAGPTAQESALTTPSATTEIPEGVEIRGVSIEGDEASVDLSEAFLASSGSLSVRLRLAQLVYTLTALGDVERVALSVEGERVTTIGDGLEIENPLTREQYAIVAPEVLIESPLPGTTLANPLLVAGSTLIPDTPFIVKVVDGGGTLVTEELLTSDGGTALFSSEIEYESSAEGTGSVEAALEDGTPVMRVVVVLQ